mmetsp:Transcript_95504/g.273948  ORF Transcript_95504/g.273948 Transcript_95504/m.273948 type:complete len:227 (+) Transcript_95504:341-1021(+)
MICNAILAKTVPRTLERPLDIEFARIEAGAKAVFREARCLQETTFSDASGEHCRRCSGANFGSRCEVCIKDSGCVLLELCDSLLGKCAPGYSHADWWVPRWRGNRCCECCRRTADRKRRRCRGEAELAAEGTRGRRHPLHACWGCWHRGPGLTRRGRGQHQRLCGSNRPCSHCCRHQRSGGRRCHRGRRRCNTSPGGLKPPAGGPRWRRRGGHPGDAQRAAGAARG